MSAVGFHTTWNDNMMARLLNLYKEGKNTAECAYILFHGFPYGPAHEEDVRQKLEELLKRERDGSPALLV